MPHVNVLGYHAALAAYRDSDDWLQQLVHYLRGNRDLLLDWVERTPKLSANAVEGTYLAWIDAREIGADNPADFFEQAGVGLSDGSNYQGDGFVRLNFGCSRELLQEAMRRMERAIC